MTPVEPLGELAESIAGCVLGPADRAGHTPVVAEDGTPRWWLISGLAATVEAHRERLDWLDSRLACPAPVRFATDGSIGQLLVEPLPGAPADEPGRPREPGVLVSELAAMVDRLHSLDVDQCPFRADWPLIVDEARTRVVSGVAQVDQLDPGLQPVGLDRALGMLEEATPDDPIDPVVTLGDFRPTVVHLDDAGSAIGITGAPTLGVGDRHLDLAVMVAALGRWMGPEAAGMFIEIYGPERVDLRRLDIALLAHGLRGVLGPGTSATGSVG